MPDALNSAIPTRDRRIGVPYRLSAFLAWIYLKFVMNQHCVIVLVLIRLLGEAECSISGLPTHEHNVLTHRKWFDFELLWMRAKAPSH